MRARFFLTAGSMYLAIAGPVLGASFDCAKASIQVEKAICSSASLSALDVALNEQYRALKSKVDADALQTDQRAWIQRRNRCAGEDCLTDEYRRRAAELSSWLTPDNQMPGAAVHETGRANFILNPTTQENDPMRSSDCIALTPIGDDVLRFDLELVGGNGHMCEMHGKAEASDEDGVYVHHQVLEPHDNGALVQCELKLRLYRGYLVLQDVAHQCRQYYCGARAGLDGVGFPRGSAARNCDRKRLTTRDDG
jgi:uncharacterized protein